MSYKNRRKSQKMRIFDLLKERGSEGATNSDFIDMDIFRYGDRIKNLRDMGIKIESKKLKGGLWRYTLEDFVDDFTKEVKKNLLVEKQDFIPKEEKPTHAKIWWVESKSNPGKKYGVRLMPDKTWKCSCPHFIFNKIEACKHVKKIKIKESNVKN